MAQIFQEVCSNLEREVMWKILRFFIPLIVKGLREVFIRSMTRKEKYISLVRLAVDRS